MTRKEINLLFSELCKYLLISMLCIPSWVSAHDITLTGRLLGEKKESLSAATVRCYQDSSFIRGTTTNAKGEFELTLQSEETYQLKFNYVGYKELVMVLHPTKEKSIRLGDIVMSNEVQQMQEVTVVAENRIQLEDKLMVFPTKEQIRHAYDGFGALRILMIPGLNVSGSSVSYMSQSVMLCINGQEATSEEVQNLFPKDIKRVDVFQQGTPDYPDAEVLIDFILKERDYAGTFSFYRAQELTKLQGNGRLSAQYFEGNSEFAISASDNYNNHTLHPENTTQTSYTFPAETITRTEQDLSGMDKKNGLKLYANYIYRDDVQNFYASLRFNRNASKEDVWSSQQYSNETNPLVKQEYKHSQNINPALQLRYNIKLPNDQRLRAELYGSYGNNDYQRWYEQRRDETLVSDYQNSTDENSWYGKMKISYSKAFKNKSSLNLEITEDFTHTKDLNTREENLSEVFLNKSNTRIYAIYNYKIQKKLDAQIRLANHISYTNTGTDHVFNSFFIPSLKFTYRPNKFQLLSLQGSVKSVEASDANRTGDEYRRNEYEMFVGNPQLKDYTQWEFALRYNWTINSRLSMYTYNEYYLTTKQAYDNYFYDGERGMFVYQQLNGGRCWNWHSECCIQYHIIPNRFVANANLLYNHSDFELWQAFIYNGFFGDMGLSYLYKNWTFWIGCTTKAKYIEPSSGDEIHTPVNLNLELTYNINNWNFCLSTRNPFVKARTTGKIVHDGYIKTYSQRTPRVSDNIVTLSVNYRFTFGKKKHKFDNTEAEDINKTTIFK